jgi:hypothetical protein
LHNGNSQSDLISAAKQLAESEIKLIKEIESSRHMNLENELATMSIQASNISNNISDKSTKQDNVIFIFLYLTTLHYLLSQVTLYCTVILTQILVFTIV